MKKIQDMEINDRPREKINKFGVSGLSNSELLQLLIGSGGKDNNVRVLSKNVERRLEDFKKEKNKPLENNLPSREYLMKVHGLGEAKASIILGALELGKRYSGAIESDLSMIDPENIYNELIDISREMREHFVILFLNNRDKAICRETISIGTLNASMVHPREVFERAIIHKASIIVGAHNHPSGDTSPSDADIKITKRLIEAGKLLGIEFYDHIIIGKTTRENKDKQKYFSFRENYEEWWE